MTRATRPAAPERAVDDAPTADPDARARRLVAVVVTYNRLDQLKVTVGRLLDAGPGVLDALLVVDNASDDGTADWLAGQGDPRLAVLRHARNLGGAGGFETGMRHAVAHLAPDWLLLMDDDGRPEPGALEAFHAARPERWDAIAAAVYYPDGTICEMNRPSVNPFRTARGVLRAVLGGRDGFHIGPACYDAPPRDVDVASFVGLFVSRRAVERVGYPDGALFVYGEDGLYTLGLSAAGGRIGFVPAIRFEHDCRTFAAEPGRFAPPWKSYYYHRNLLFLYRRAAGPLFWPALALVLPKWLLKVRRQRGARWTYLRLLGLAVAHGLTGHTGTPHEAILSRARGRRISGS
ncbi:glycosyltransferase [Rhodosalinus sediminis]|uniref:Glycosyltransferase n=1 Tax=Rhodosalinus sediminis TaxID=1940533 RepID=A0A3D9BWS1_9RHOB|nr:glycosyltransferase [Rhodosalinus sediminis]